MKNQPLSLTIFSLLLFLTACGSESNLTDDKSDNTQHIERGALRDSKLIKTTKFLKYAVNAYEITYTSVDADGKEVVLSGLLAIPQKTNNKTSPLLSFQHGTRFDNDNRPTSATSKNPISIADIAGVGYIVAAPDYLGYGASLKGGRTPSYIHFQSYVNASIDMLRASKAFLKKSHIAFNQQLFLMGYSEGGYATLSLQKGIQEQFDSEFTVTASAAGAGPYDLSETTKFLAKKAENESASFMSFVIKSYNDIYKLDAIDEMYQPKFVKPVNTVFDALHTGGEINKQLTRETEKLFKPDFLVKLRGTGTHKIIDKIAENNIYNWTPKAPTLLFHSEYDETVPYLNSQNAYNAMIANDTQNVSLEKCGMNRFGTHVYCAPRFIARAKSFFDNYNPDL